MTAAPTKPRVGQRVVVSATGQVGDRGGHLYIYRDRKGCLASARAERRRGVLMASVPINGTFELRRSFRPRRGGSIWVCGYLYAITCDAGGRNCGPATGLPPDAGFTHVRVRVRSSSQAAKASAASGRVIT